MNRPIKFRGRRLDNGQWVCGDLLHPITGLHTVNYTEHDNGSTKRADYHYFDVDEKTIGQYTGLKDRNGREIYEGDIVRLSGDYVTEYYGFEQATVQWIPKYACFSFIIPRPVEEVENEIDTVMGGKYVSPEEYEDWFEMLGANIIDICHMMRPSFQSPKPEFEVIGNIHDGELAK